MTGGSPWERDPPVGRALEPWFFWGEEIPDAKPRRFGRLPRASRPGKPASPGKAAKPDKAAKPEEAARPADPDKAAEFNKAAEPDKNAARPAGAGNAATPQGAGQASMAGRPGGGVPEAAPDSGHRGSRARLIRRPIATAVVLAGVLVVTGGAVGLTRMTAGHRGDIARPVAEPAPAPHGIFAAPPQAHSARPVARPVALIIPAIRVRTALERLGRTPQGTLEVPTSTTVAGWYAGSPRPGEIGSSIIAGHIDSTLGPGVFFRLRLLRPGNLVYVRRADGRLAVFRVYAEHMYPKDDFPTEQVYGPVPDPELHLITCGGVFDPVTGSYLSNVVVYAAQVSVRPPRHHHGRRRDHQPRARHS